MAASDIICVTNRILCEKNNESFEERIRKIVEAEPYAIILREKDLSLSEYRELAKNAARICSQSKDLKFIIHNFYELILENYEKKNISVSGAGEYEYLHMPLNKLKELYDNRRDVYNGLLENLMGLGASCHSVEDAMLAEKLGCTYIIAGHIYDTDCKKGLEGRGLEFLKSVAESVDIPVYAIGGITTENISDVRNAGASGACIMSSAMTCDSPRYLIKRFAD